jgi:methyl-accepting chemotaxis protein
MVSWEWASTARSCKGFQESSMIRLIRNLSIGAKVAVAPAIAIVGMVLVACLGIHANSLLESSVGRMANAGGRLELAGEISARTNRLNALIYQGLSWEGAEYGSKLLAEQDNRVDEEFSSLKRLLEASLDNSAARTSPHPAPNSASLEALREVQAALFSYEKAARSVMKVRSSGLGFAASYMAATDNGFKRVAAATTGLVVIERTAMTTQKETAATLVADNIARIGAGLLVAFVLSLFTAVCASRLIVRPLMTAQTLACSVASGDLVIEREALLLPTNDDATGDLLRSLRSVAQNLSGMVLRIRQGARQIDASAEQLETGNRDLANRTEKSASALQQTAATMEELTTSVRQTADNAGSAGVLAGEATTSARECGRAVDEVNMSMCRIEEHARKVADVTVVIDAIAFQTNILALNAAVEAARAGEQGRGFAVVAKSVRELAQKSSEAARDIKRIISTSIQEVAAGSSKVSIAAARGNLAVASIEKLEGEISQIASAISEQSRALSSVNASIAEMDESTQRNAVLVDEATSGASLLKIEATQLVQSVDQFRLAV